VRRCVISPCGLGMRDEAVAHAPLLQPQTDAPLQEGGLCYRFIGVSTGLARRSNLAVA
jgi:hypothetical protein